MDKQKKIIILDEKGEVADLCVTNEKGYRKSIENSDIWILNPETGRLLPHERGFTAVGFSEKDDWYEARVAADEAEAGKTVSAAADESVTEKNAIEQPAPGGAPSAVIDRLFKVIEERRRTLPEGSYTTHLFNSGMPKIKKKTGEEAVELLLAETKDEITYEAADLVYHMLVLLSAAGISPDEVFEELKGRE